jgi:hypothetical protein
MYTSGCEWDPRTMQTVPRSYLWLLLSLGHFGINTMHFERTSDGKGSRKLSLQLAADNISINPMHSHRAEAGDDVVSALLCILDSKKAAGIRIRRVFLEIRGARDESSHSRQRSLGRVSQTSLATSQQMWSRR